MNTSTYGPNFNFNLLIWASPVIFPLLQRRALCCKQLRNPSEHGDIKDPYGETLLHLAIGLEEDQLAVALLEAGVSVTAVNSWGETAWKKFVRSWGARWYGAKFYVVLKAFIARLGASVDVTCERPGESTLHRYGEHLVADHFIGHLNPHPGIVQVKPCATGDSLHCLFLLLNAGCRVNARDRFQDLPFQTSVFGQPNSVAPIPMFDEMWLMLADAGSRLHRRFTEAQKLAIVLKSFIGENPVAELLPLHALGLLAVHSAHDKARLRARIRLRFVCDDIINKLCQPVTLKNLCLNYIRMNCHPNAFVGASKLPLPPDLQEGVRPLYHTYKEMCGSTSGGIHISSRLRRSRVRSYINSLI